MPTMPGNRQSDTLRGQFRKPRDRDERRGDGQGRDRQSHIGHRANVWAARIIPVILFGLLGYTAYLVTGAIAGESMDCLDIHEPL